MFLYSSKQMNDIDRYNEEVLGVSTVTLMGRAGKALASAVKSVAKKKIAIVCGTGNNGGDGLAAAVDLIKSSYVIDVFYIDEIKSNASMYYYKQLIEYGIKPLKAVGQDFSQYDVIVDAIFGTGLKKAVDGIYKEIIQAINQSNAYIISADIPSGLNSDNGLIMGECVKADVTVTFVGYKLGRFLNDGIDVCGQIVLDDLNAAILEKEKIIEVPDKVVLPKRARAAHKGNFAGIKIIAGSDKMCGAAYLGLSSAKAALLSGAGLVTLAVPSSIKCAYMPRVTESMLYFLSDQNGQIVFDKAEIDILLQKADVLIIGMGLGKSEQVKKIIDYVLKNFELTVVVDADGLNSLDLNSLQDTKSKVIITPHVGEFARLIDKSIEEVKNDPIGLAKQFSNEYGVITVLKSNCTVITDGNRVLVNITGTGAQAKGGSGDVLSGCMGALVKILEPIDACFVACFICGQAAINAEHQKGSYSVLASDVIDNIPSVIKGLISLY